jgi:hypothetical protein
MLKYIHKTVSTSLSVRCIVVIRYCGKKAKTSKAPFPLNILAASTRQYK